jgi:hypothetical protein
MLVVDTDGILWFNHYGSNGKTLNMCALPSFLLFFVYIYIYIYIKKERKNGTSVMVKPEKTNRFYDKHVSCEIHYLPTYLIAITPTHTHTHTHIGNVVLF